MISRGFNIRTILSQSEWRIEDAALYITKPPTKYDETSLNHEEIERFNLDVERNERDIRKAIAEGKLPTHHDFVEVIRLIVWLQQRVNDALTRNANETDFKSRSNSPLQEP